MALFSHGTKLCKRFSPRYFIPNLASCATDPAIVDRETSNPEFKISETHPGKHTLADAGKYYEIPPEMTRELISAGIWPRMFKKQCKIFQETCLLVRKPGLEIIEYIKNSDYTRPIHKYVLYGPNGAGKTCILSYVLHYAVLEGWLIVNVPWAPKWLKSHNEIKPSETMEGCYDVDVLSTKWLTRFKNLNLNILNRTQITIKNDYEWNSRESSKAGDTLLSIIDYGIMRGTFSSDVLTAVLKEIKLACQNNEVKCMVFIDGFNAIFNPYTQLKNEKKELVTADKVTSLISFKKMALADWHNGAAILTVDSIAINNYEDSYLPLHLLSLEGFEYIHPFVPIEVQNYNDLEFKCTLDYYRDRHWLRTKKGDNQLKYLTGRNGFQLMELCQSL